MNKHIKRGGIKLKTKKNDSNADIDNITIHTNCLLFFIENSIIELISDSSAFSLIYLLKFQKDSLESPFVRITNDANNSDIVEIIMKICLIDENEKQWYNGDKSSMQKNKLKNEICKQQEIYLKTIKYYDALCPSIIFYLFSQIKTLKSLLLSKTKDDYTKNSFNLLNDNDEFGIIFMEFAQGFQPINKYGNNEFVENMARNQLIELAKLGYNHSDFHKNNIMFNPEYKHYYDGIDGKVLLIDFGFIDRFYPINNERPCSTLTRLYYNKFANIPEKYKKEVEEKYKWILCNNDELNDKLGLLGVLRDKCISNLKYNLLDTDELTNNFIKLQTNEIKHIGGATTDFVSNVLNQPSLAMQQPAPMTQQPSLAMQKPAPMTQQPSLAPQQSSLEPKQPSLAPQQPSLAPQQPSLAPQQHPTSIYPQNIVEDAIDDILFIYLLLSNNDNMVKINAIINNR
jgi:hypothetical protein